MRNLSSTSDLLPARSSMPICPQCGQRHGLSHSLCSGCLEDDRRLSGDDSSVDRTCETANLGETVSEVNDEQGEGEIADAENGPRGVAIARFQNGAAAGFFA